MPPSGVPSAGSRRLPGILDVLNPKKRGSGARSCIRVEAATGSVQTIEVGKAPMMRRCELPARDLRLLDTLFVYPYTILNRECASVQTIEVGKAPMMRRCELPARDLRLLDTLFVYPYTILNRECAIIVNLEQIRFVLAADEVLLLNSVDIYVFQYAVELHRCLLQRADGDELPFEFRALELALEAASSFLEAQGFPLQRYGNGAGGDGDGG